ncbi:c-type cytochrome [Neptuniibacter sp.]|uniref:c-type cytochrome n=1 Tax=Neptuniibacter sp. TaxID=1962643 RepID=UPI003B5BD066
MSIKKLLAAFCFISLLQGVAHAHNNPDFKQVEIGVLKYEKGQSNSIKLSIPDKTTKLIWKVTPELEKGTNIILLDSEGSKLESIQSGSESKDLALYKDQTISLAKGSALGESFEVKVIANVIDRSKKHSLASSSVGKKVYKKANCMGCHKWHGGGGGGYGGAAANLRETQLDRGQIKFFVSCGILSTRMPFHGRSAYKNESEACYGKTQKELGEMAAPRARILLSDREINAVSDYVFNVIKDKGEPTQSECFDFWGETSRMCKAMK